MDSRYFFGMFEAERIACDERVTKERDEEKTSLMSVLSTMGVKPGIGLFGRGWPAPYNDQDLYGDYRGWDLSSIRLEDVRKIHIHRSMFMPVDVYMGMLRDDKDGVLGDDSFLPVLNDPLPLRSKRSRLGKSGFCCRPGDVVKMANRVSAADALFMPVDVYMGMLRDDNDGVLGDDSFLPVLNDPLPPLSKRSKHGKSGFCCRPGDVVNMANRVSAADAVRALVVATPHLVLHYVRAALPVMPHPTSSCTTRAALHVMPSSCTTCVLPFT